MVEKLNLSSTRCWNMKKMQLIVNSIWVIKQGEQYKTGARKRQNRRHIYCKNDFQIMHLFCKMSYISYPSWQPIHFKWHTTPFSNTFLHHLIGIAKYLTVHLISVPPTNQTSDHSNWSWSGNDVSASSVRTSAHLQKTLAHH